LQHDPDAGGQGLAVLDGGYQATARTCSDRGAAYVLANRGTSWYLRFSSRYVLSGSYRSWPYSGDHHPGFDELVGLLLRCLPGLAEERLRVFVLHVIMVLADVEQRLDEPSFDDRAAVAAVADLRATALALLTAPRP
ncbi:hypothetical protein ACWEPC_42235, partial [Nonomuraea sp. NPDC004297]